MRKHSIIVIALVITLLMIVGCDKKEKIEDSSIPDTYAIAIDKDKPLIIGIAKIISHPALDDMERGIIDGLKESDYKNITIDVQNANGEMNTAASIANKFRNEGAHVVVGIATPTAQALANNIGDIPIVFGAVTDPISAGLRKTDGIEDSNITGISDLTPVKEQIKLATLLKDVKKLGFIYNPGEDNSIALLKITKEVCNDLGIELITTTVTNTSEIKQATEFLAPKVDVIYATTDNIVYAALNTVASSAARFKVPVIAAVPDDNPETGTLASYGIDYYTSGKSIADLVIRILNGENPGDIPVVYPKGASELSLYINEDVAKDMGIVVNDKLLKQMKPMKKY